MQTIRYVHVKDSRIITWRAGLMSPQGIVWAQKGFDWFREQAERHGATFVLHRGRVPKAVASNLVPSDLT